MSGATEYFHYLFSRAFLSASTAVVASRYAEAVVMSEKHA
jgi:hypothetical protein